MSNYSLLQIQLRMAVPRSADIEMETLGLPPFTLLLRARSPVLLDVVDSYV